MRGRDGDGVEVWHGQQELVPANFNHKVKFMIPLRTLAPAEGRSQQILMKSFVNIKHQLDFREEKKKSKTNSVKTFSTKIHSFVETAPDVRRHGYRTEFSLTLKRRHSG